MRAFILSAILVFAVSACAATPLPKTQSDSNSSFFGVATLKADGELCLHMRTEEPGAPVAESILCYKASDPKYAEIRKHVGPISVGEQKVFGPFTK